MNHAEKIIQRAGGVPAVADALGITINAVYAWRRNGYIPLNRAKAVAKLAGMRPDMVAKRAIP